MSTQSTLQILIVCAALSVGSLAKSDIITDWNTAALQAIRADNTPPPKASRALAILHASIYDAVNGIVRVHKPYFVEEKGPLTASQEAAASAAAFKVLVSLFPNGAQSFEQLHESILEEIRDSPRKHRGLEWGESVAEKVLLWRATDGFDAVVPAPPSSEPGDWRPTTPAYAPYLLPQWGFVKPFAIPRIDFFRPGGPPALTSAKYAADYNEVKALGEKDESTRTPEQTQIALFWADGAGTSTPPGHWNLIAQDVSAARRNTMQQNARLFALLNVAMADAAICAWDAKYHYNFWRPVTAIRMGNIDGNPETVPDPDWEPLIITPPFPDYISGHSTFSGAAAAVLSLFYRTPRLSFTTGTESTELPPGTVRRFRGFLETAAEAALSRMYGGIHFRSANEDGLKSGLAIGGWTFTHTMQ
jgi:membrane-associated phospholipid phosphatase